MDEKMKTLANSILEQCYEQGLTFQQARTLMMVITQRIDEAKERAMKEAGKDRMRFIPFQVP